MTVEPTPGPATARTVRSSQAVLYAMAAVGLGVAVLPRTPVVIGAGVVFAFAAMAAAVSRRAPPTTAADSVVAAPTPTEPIAPDRSSEVLTSLPDAVIAIDARGRVVVTNESAGRLFGVAKATEGKPLAEATRDAAVGEAVDIVRLRRTPAESESSSDDRHVRVSAYPLPDGTIVVVGRDETELKRLERLRRDFVANVSHELKTPLTSIRAFAETLLEGVEDADRRQTFVRRILEQSDRLHELIIDLIRLAQAESSEPVRLSEVRLAGLAEEAVRSVAEIAHRRGIDVEVESADLPAVTTDADGLRSAVGNIVRNAVLYTPEGGRVTVTVAAQQDTQTVSVRDTGVGIAPADQKRIFERFYRVDKARTRSTGGSGLGLAIARRAVERLGGTIDLRSEVGRGSTFTITVPVDAAGATPGRGNWPGDLTETSHAAG